MVADADDDNDEDDDDEDGLSLMITPSTAEHRLFVRLDANRKHVVLFPTTWHADDVTFGNFSGVISGDANGGCGVGGRGDLGRPTNMDRATIKPATADDQKLVLK